MNCILTHIIVRFRSHCIKYDMTHLKRLQLLVMAVSWFYAGSHCYLADAFATSSDNHSRHSHNSSHCGDTGGNGSGEKNQSHHSKCQGNGCCQPIITSGDPSSFAATEISLTQLPLHVTPLLVGWSLSPVGMERSILHCLSPPEAGQWSLVLSLKQAPNAPPVILRS